MPATNLLVVGHPTAPYLKMLAELPDDVNIAVGNRPEAFVNLGAEADAVLYCMMAGISLKEIWPVTKKVKWVHSMSAGLDTMLFPELVEGPAVLTNARGVYKESLGEFGMLGIMYFAKDIPRMRRNQKARKWEQFDVDMVDRQTLGIIGYGEIGRSVARRAHAMGMRIIATRRRPELNDGDPYVTKSFHIDDRKQLMAESDFVLVCSALTPETLHLVGEAEFRSMKPSGIIMNLGRGPIIDEVAMAKALEQKWIRGAVLDVFDQEPLPESSPLWDMDNVLVSPHCADHTSTWMDDSMRFFVENFHRYIKGEPLQNVVDKKSGY